MALKTSVIIPVYNSELYLAECLDSVLAQTQDSFEVICVDDGSTDASADILASYWERHRSVRVITQENRCLGGARNTGAKAARGKYLYFLDADDLLEPDALECCYAYCEEHQLECVTFDSRGFVEEDGTRQIADVGAVHDRSGNGIESKTWTGVDYWLTGYDKGYILYPCWVHYLRRDFFVQHELWFEEGLFYEDNDWLFRLYRSVTSLRYLPKVLHSYRWHPQSITHRTCSPKHIHSCTRIADILAELYQSTADDRERSMVIDLAGGGVWRLKHLLSIESGADVDKTVLELAKRQVSCIDACEDDMAILRMRLGMLRLAAQRLGMPHELVRLFPYERLLLEPGRRIGIFGTGKRTGMILDSLSPLKAALGNTEGPELVFFETNADEGKTYRGAPVVNVAAAKAAGLDAVLYFSSAYAEEMLCTIKEVWGDDMPTETVDYCSMLTVWK